MTSSNSRSGLSRLWDGLKAFQNRVAIALTVVVLFLLYFSVFAVVALAARLSGKDLLEPDHPVPGSHWLARQPAENSLESLSRQF